MFVDIKLDEKDIKEIIAARLNSKAENIIIQVIKKEGHPYGNVGDIFATVEGDYIQPKDFFGVR